MSEKILQCQVNECNSFLEHNYIKLNIKLYQNQ